MSKVRYTIVTAGEKACDELISLVVKDFKTDYENDNSVKVHGQRVEHNVKTLRSSDSFENRYGAYVIIGRN